MSDRTNSPSQSARGEHCPWWCTNTQPDHATEYDLSENGDDQILYRIHSRYFGNSDLGVTQDEKNDHGVTSMLPVALHLYGEPETPAEARQYAGWLAESAALLERIDRTDETLTVATESGTYVVPPCPTWCILPSDHDMADPIAREFDGGLHRMHRAGEWTVLTYEAGEKLRVEVDWSTVVGSKDEAEATQPPSVLVVTNTASLDVHQARMAAAALTSAADTLAAILGDSR